MKICLILCFAVLTGSETHARLTYRQQRLLAEPAESVSNTIDQQDDVDSIDTTQTASNNVKVGECECSGSTCTCCKTLSFIYYSKRYNIVFCARLTNTGSSIYVELLADGTIICSEHFTQAGIKGCSVYPFFKIGIRPYVVNETNFCFFLYYMVDGKFFRYSFQCVTLPAPSFGTTSLTA